jgi:hypothetical protein
LRRTNQSAADEPNAKAAMQGPLGCLSGLESTMKSLLAVVFLVTFWLVHRIVQWRLRIVRIGRTMAVVPLVFDPYRLERLLVPKRWQKYHSNWQFERRKEFDGFGTGVLPLICLFGRDIFFVSDADAIVEMATNPIGFPKDLKLYGAFWQGLSDGSIA